MFSSQRTKSDIKDFNLEKYDLVFNGIGLDLRGKEACKFTSGNSKKLIECDYNPVEFIFETKNDGEYKPSELVDLFNKYNPKTILLEGTTLKFSELLIILSTALKCDSVKKISFTYIEPKEYKLKLNTEYPMPHRYDLTSGFGRLYPIPGFTKDFSRKGYSAHLIAFLGFEKTRFGRVVEDDEGANIDKFSLIMAIPPFCPGWENSSLEHNSEYFINDRYEDVYFVPANNPSSAYNLLKKVQKSLGEKEKMIIAPFGTNLSAIGAAVYASENQSICGVIYDHPRNQDGRSKGIGISHLYTIEK